MRKISFAAFLFVLVVTSACSKKEEAPPAAQPQAATEKRPGLYMTFDTSEGAITCRLYENEAPNTVATIVGLALGTRPYLDARTGKKIEGKPFYDGLTFHRVIPSFMIQGGDPLGTGMGGPDGPRGFAKQAAELGFPFDNEIHPSLKFDVPGRLAMANTGRPKTNGSQFFITEEPTPHLNGLHTIFGDCSGLSIVRRIARVPASSPVTIKKVTVERVGPKPAKAPEG